MEIRRAILLFAVVLGVAAIVSSVARPPDTSDDPPTTSESGGTGGPASAEPTAEAPPPTTVEFRSGARPHTHKIELGQPATVRVDVETPAQIDIPSLGLTDAAEPLTPAVFDVLETAPGKHPIIATPAAADTVPDRIGTLQVVAGS